MPPASEGTSAPAKCISWSSGRTIADVRASRGGAGRFDDPGSHLGARRGIDRLRGGTRRLHAPLARAGRRQQPAGTHRSRRQGLSPTFSRSQARLVFAQTITDIDVYAFEAGRPDTRRVLAGRDLGPALPRTAAASCSSRAAPATWRNLAGRSRWLEPRAAHTRPRLLAGLAAMVARRPAHRVRFTQLDGWTDIWKSSTSMVAACDASPTARWTR